MFGAMLWWASLLVGVFACVFVALFVGVCRCLLTCVMPILSSFQQIIMT